MVGNIREVGHKATLASHFFDSTACDFAVLALAHWFYEPPTTVFSCTTWSHILI